jgi:hypothetical protein
MARPGRPCKICSDAVLVAKVDSLLQTGESVRAIAALTGVDRFAIARHRRHSGFAPAVAPDPDLDELQLSERRLESLANRLEQQYAAAVSTGDNRVCLEVTKVLSRIESERHHRLVDRKQKESDDDNDKLKEWPTILQATNVKRKVDEAHARDVANGAIMCPVCGGRPVTQKQIQFFRSHDVHNGAN